MNKVVLLTLLIFLSTKAFAQQYILDEIYDERRDIGETPFSNLIVLVIVIGVLYLGYKIFHKEEKNDNNFDPNDEFYEELMSMRDEDPNELDIIDAERLSEDLLSRSSFGLEESIPIYIHVVGYKRHFAFEDDEEKKKHELFYCICDVLHNEKSIVNVIGESYFPTERGEYTDVSDWGGNNDNPIEEDDEIEPIENICFAQTIQDEYWEILINEEFDPKLLNLFKIEITNDSENPFVYSSGIVEYNHDLYSIKQLDWLEYYKLVDSKIK